LGVSSVYIDKGLPDDVERARGVTMKPRYPDLRISLRSRNPFALVSAVRQAMRHSGVDEVEILSFTEKALAANQPEHMRQVCSEWAWVSLPNGC